jgi:hypothetical protein
VFARTLAARGYNLVLVARRKERLQELGAELAAAHGTVTEALEADLSAAAELARVERRIKESAVDLLINNAGFGLIGRFSSGDVEGQDQMHRVHVTATMRLTHAALSGMIERRKGGVINVSSVAAFTQNPGSVSYCASKAWINSFTEGVYLELKAIRSPVRAQVLCPGYTYTEFHDVIKWDRKNVASWLWMPAQAVVDASLRGLERDRLFVVPGWPYRAVVLGARYIPRFIWHSTLLRAAKRMGRSIE